MGAFLLRRVLHSLILLGIVTVIGFSVLHLTPGGPLSQYANTPGMTQTDLDRIASQMGLDRPLPIQYLEWCSQLLLGNWGTSYRDGTPVVQVIARHIPATMLLMLTATVLSIGIGTIVGVVGAIRRYSIFDYVATTLSMVALSIPTFWFGLVGIYIFSLQLGWLPAGNMTTMGDGSLTDRIWHLIMPSAVLALVQVAVWSRYMRASMLEVISQDYVRTARSKGLKPRSVLVSHVLRNAMIPMITLAGIQFPNLLSGALVAETVFTWPGMGRLFLDSLNYGDYPVVMGFLMLSAILVLLSNLAADVLVAAADPRVRLD